MDFEPMCPGFESRESHDFFFVVVFLCFFCHYYYSTNLQIQHYHWLGAYRTNALYSGHIFVRFNDLEDVFT